MYDMGLKQKRDRNVMTKGCVMVCVWIWLSNREEMEHYDIVQQ